MKRARVIAENFEKETKDLFQGFANQAMLNEIKNALLANKLLVIKNAKTDTRTEYLIKEMKIDLSADLEKIKSREYVNQKKIRPDSEANIIDTKTIVQQINEVTATHETKLIQNSKLYAPFKAKPTPSQLDALSAFIALLCSIANYFANNCRIIISRIVA